MTVAADHVWSRYRGYDLLVTDRDVTVYRHSRRLARVASIGAARRFIRGYHRDTVNAEPTASLAKATAGSDSEGA